MADSKITALTAISTVDPTADPLVIVDVSDTSMAASGTTKKATINQLLGASGTATLASATITGAASAAGLSVTGSTIPTNGVYLPSANNLGFAYNSTLGMTLNSTGLGVGKVPASNQSKVQIYQALGTSLNGAIHITDDATTSFVFNNTSSGVSSIWTSGVLTFSTGSNAYSTNGARMTLDASGNLLVGSALPVSGGRISGNSSTGPAGRFFSSAGDNQFAAMFDKSSATNTTSQWFIGFTINNQSTGSGQINANGASQAAFGTFSDSRLKENIVSLPSQLANILSLRPVEFDYKDGSGHQIGFVAQEMQEVYSDTVSEQNGFLTVTGWSKTEARLVSAIKELAAKVQALEAKLA